MSSLNYKEPKELYELKEKAIKYYNENGVPNKMEEILNSMFYDNPHDVYGYLVNFFDKFTKPAVIKKLSAHKVLDGRGQPTIKTDLFCSVRNEDKFFATSVSPSPNSYLLDNAKLEDRESDDQRRAESVKQAIQYINDQVSPELQGMQANLQTEIDGIVASFVHVLKEKEETRRMSEKSEEAPEEIKPPSPSKDVKGKTGKSAVNSLPVKDSKVKKPSAFIVPDEPREIFVLGSEMVCAVSQVVCVAGARTLGISLYDHIASLYHSEPCQYRMPLPIVTIMQSGKAALGKLNCIKEFMIIPSPLLSYTQSLDYITGIYSYVEKSLVTKGGVGLRLVNETGALCPVFDKAEQGLDLLIEAITAANLIPGQDIYIAINAAGHEMFDFEKGRYEVVTGLLKSFDELVEFWVELLGRYQPVIMVIDPMRKQESDQWLRLCDRITERCFVASERMYPRPGLLKDKELPEKILTGAVVLALENLTTVSDLFACAKKMEGVSNQIILSARAGETQDDFLVDLAVGINARFLKLGAPNRGERISKYNRLLQIEAELEMSGKLAPPVNHEFIHIALPPLPEGEEEMIPTSPFSATKDSRKDTKKK